MQNLQIRQLSAGCRKENGKFPADGFDLGTPRDYPIIRKTRLHSPASAAVMLIAALYLHKTRR